MLIMLKAENIMVLSFYDSVHHFNEKPNYMSRYPNGNRNGNEERWLRNDIPLKNLLKYNYACLTKVTCLNIYNILCQLSTSLFLFY